MRKVSSDVVVGDGWQGSGGRQRPSRGPDSSAAYSEMVRLAQAAGFSSPAEMMIMQQQQLMTEYLRQLTPSSPRVEYP